MPLRLTRHDVSGDVEKRLLALEDVFFTFWMIAVDMKHRRVDHLPDVRAVE
jgi:hypothetical protein